VSIGSIKFVFKLPTQSKLDNKQAHDVVSTVCKYQPWVPWRRNLWTSVWTPHNVRELLWLPEWAGTRRGDNGANLPSEPNHLLSMWFEGTTLPTTARGTVWPSCLGERLFDVWLNGVRGETSRCLVKFT